MFKEYEIFEHTADAGIIAYGKDITEAFANAAKGLFSLITSLEDIVEEESREVKIVSADRAGLLVDWLNELIFLFDTENTLYRRFDIQEMTENSLKAVIYGEKINPLKHEIKTGIKAATWHMLEIDGEKPGRVRVLFDI